MSSNKNWKLLVDEKVYRQLAKFPKKESLKLINFLEKGNFEPYTGDIRKIKGEQNVWRKRLGSYRIFYEIYQTKSIIHIFWIERRTSKTY